MYQLAKPLFLHCETPLHAGSGSELGIIDLPIQRERHTGFPKIEGSGLKGALRERFEQYFIQLGEITDLITRKHDRMYDAFGPHSDSGDLYAGALGISDARLLLFPVKSMRGIFAWITCPEVLQRFRRDMQSCAGVNFDLPLPEANTRTSQSRLPIKDNGDKVVLEEYTFAVSVSDSCSDFASWLGSFLFPENEAAQQSLKHRLLVLSDDDFKDFINLSTEVITRTKIDNLTGTVADGALFTEEYLPSESVLYSLILASPSFKNPNTRIPEAEWIQLRKPAQEIMASFANTLKEGCGNRLQAGGNATLGKGHIRTQLIHA